MSGNNDWDRKSINKLHFIYIVCILGVAILLLLATILLDYTETVATLSNSGILLSIVLAIVAILITLWDVAGQKNALGDIREQINSIKEITDDIKESAELSKELVAELQDFDSRFGVNFDPIKEMLDSISNEIKSPSEPIEVDGLEKAVEELRTLVNEKEKNLNHMKESIVLEKQRPRNNRQLLRVAAEYIKNLDTGVEFTRNQLENYISSTSSVDIISSLDVIYTLGLLEDLGFIVHKKEGVYMKI